MDDLNLKPENAEFGQYLRSVRQAKKISIRQLAKAVSKTPTYISDIEKGNNKPPERELLDRIIAELHLEEFPDIKNRIYDLSALTHKSSFLNSAIFIPPPLNNLRYFCPDLLFIWAFFCRSNNF